MILFQVLIHNNHYVSNSLNIDKKRVLLMLKQNL